MKHMRKALSLLLVLAMVVCFAVPAFADGTTTETKVTVYITKGKFTKGGIDDDGNQVSQAYIGGIPSDTDKNAKKVELTVESITDKELSQVRNSYNAPAGMSSTVNVLDVIGCALSRSSLSYTGGWDTWNTPNGGYISSVAGYTGESKSEEVEINDTLYTKYTGSGWNIAFSRGNGFEVPEYYGTNYNVVNNMIIVFDFSAYELYYAA